MSKKLPEVGPLEMQVLGVVGANADSSVNEIQQSLKSGGQELAYTTVMTVLVRLYNKGLVKRKKEGRQYLYTVVKKKDSSPAKILERVKTSLFGSEKLKPILGLLDSDDALSKAELEELKRAVDEKLKKAKK
ncbi:MAG: BlaI/MecI/CopY family transcriptional regulator [Bdellovibrionaceae bacterium]|nr:BlaI/MecI/CopY family transcriptional regulator [Pseudobdellovibrionaceae bacterium]